MIYSVSHLCVCVWTDKVTEPIAVYVSMASPAANQRPGGGQTKMCQFKLVLLGESAVGKSSLVLRFVKGQFHEYQESTIGGMYHEMIPRYVWSWRCWANSNHDLDLSCDLNTIGDSIWGIMIQNIAIWYVIWFENLVILFELK